MQSDEDLAARFTLTHRRKLQAEPAAGLITLVCQRPHTGTLDSGLPVVDTVSAVTASRGSLSKAINNGGFGISAALVMLHYFAKYGIIAQFGTEHV